jgi:hypothetical protein
MLLGPHEVNAENDITVIVTLQKFPMVKASSFKLRRNRFLKKMRHLPIENELEWKPASVK